MKIPFLVLVLPLIYIGGNARAADATLTLHPPTGEYETSWVGNSLGGNGWPNGVGEWVQDGAASMDVSDDGTLIAGVNWDEGGRCAGLYKGGKTNYQTLQLTQADGAKSAWGWGTGNGAVTINGNSIFIGNTGKRLLQFSWTPGGLESAKYVKQASLPEKPIGINSRGDAIVVVYPDSVELRSTKDLSVTNTFKVSEAKGATLAQDGSLWILAASAVHHYSAKGDVLGDAVPDLGAPTAVAFDNQHRLMVCDNGPDQQVKFFDVSAAPKLVATFGDKGGIGSGTPGLAEPTKLFSLRGAGTDAVGNIFVAMSLADGPQGNLHLRSFTPDGKLRWQMMNFAFVDTFGFDPESDGSKIYTRNAVFDLDLTKTQPGSEWSFHALTVDPVAHPDDPRLGGPCSAYLRWLQGRRLLVTIGQMAGGCVLYAFDDPKGWIARRVDQTAHRGTWAWDIVTNGDIWNGDAEGRTIRRYAFKGWKPDGAPDYDWAQPQSWPRPADFARVTRTLYDPASDSLYIFGYLKGQPGDSWGVVGKTGRRYDGWMSGNPKLAWTTTELPSTPNGLGKDKPLSAKGVALAGDYLFFAMVMPQDNIQYVHIFSTKDGSYVGSFQPGPAVGHAGWVDMPYSVQAVRRSNGEYLVIVEDDWRGKNILYRWKPDATKLN